MKLVIFGIFLLFISSQALTCNEIKSAFFIKNNCDADETCKIVCDDLKSSFKSQNCSCNTITGTVVDGPLENALVFADKNKNGIQDADEPWTITDSNGQYTLEKEEMEEIIVTARSTDDTMDTSTGAMVADVILRAPFGASVISPLSDLIYELSERNSLNTNEATSMVTQTLGLSDAPDILDLNPYRIEDTDSANNFADITPVRVQAAAANQLIEAVQDVEALLAIVIDPTQTLNNSMSELYEEDDIETMSVLLNAKKMTQVVNSSITLAQTKNATFSSEATTIQTESFQQVKNVDCYSKNVCVANWDPSKYDCVATEYKLEGTGCNDGLDTTKDDVCNDANQCTGTTITCPDDTQCTTYQPNGVDCDITHKANGTVCDDNSDITTGDVCDGAGQCAGTIIIYPNNTQCTTYSPNGIGYDTVHKADDTSCDDSLNTTKNDLCDGAGQCTGTPITCPDETQCTTYQTNGEGCDTVHKADDTSCDDSLNTTKNDLCDGAGQCTGTAITCPDETQCTTYQANGEDCDTVHKANGIECDDYLNTTKDDVCDGAGQCSGTAITCDANTRCTTYQANGEGCDTVHKTEGTVCDDSSSSTKNDLCDGTGQCIGCSENDPSNLCIGHSDNTEITYKTQEGGCPVYEESAADCNEGENEADSPCKCTICEQIEIYMIKNGQFCINGNWSLN